MSWKKGKVTFDDGTTYPAEMLIKEDGSVWNLKIHKDGEVIEEIGAGKFAAKFGKAPEDVYPYSYKIDE